MQINLSDILIPPVEKDEKYGLIKKSIEEHDLFHQVLLHGNAPPYKVLAGKKRVAIFSELGRESIEARLFEEEIKNPQEISLHENLRRNNLSWHEQVELEFELNNLRVQEHGQKRMGRDWGNNKGWTKEMTAIELGISMGGLSQDLKLAEALLINPELRNVKDKGTALKLIRLAEKRVSNELESLRPPEIEMNKALLGNSEEILKFIKSETFDVCLTDPPWSEYKDEGVPQITLLPVFKEVFRVLKPNSFLYVITSTTDFTFYLQELPKIGFQVQKYPIIWHKPKTITHGRRTWEYARDFEPILVAAKGSPSLTAGVEYSAVLRHDNVHVSKMIHEHEKPVSLITELLQQCSYQGAKILDPFAGSGVLGEACRATGRHFLLVEKDYNKFKRIERRLA